MNIRRKWVTFKPKTLETKLLDNNFDIDLFNSLAPNPLQSWEWGDTRKSIGKDVLRFGKFENDTLTDVYTVILYPLPRVKYKVGHLIFSKIPDNSSIKIISEELAKYQVIFLKIEPYIYSQSYEEVKASLESWKKNLYAENIESNDQESRYMYEQTIILDLTKEESELSKELRKSTRYTIKNAFQKGVTFEETQNFEDFWKVFESTALRQNYYGHDENYHIKVWETMNKKFAKFFIAKFNDTILSAFEIFFFNKRAYYVYSGSSSEQRHLGGSSYLMWETILCAKKDGITEFDLWGVGDKPSFRGFSAFKEGYGGKKVYLMPGIDIILDKKLYFGYKILNKARTWVNELVRNN